MTDPAAIIRALLDLTVWTVHDVDEAGRVLAGNDASGSQQLVEIAPDGTRTPLTALPGSCSGRYVPGARRVVVQHDTGGDERAQLSLLDLGATALPAGLVDLAPLVHDPAFMHHVGDITATSLVYDTNRRNGVDFDVVVRSWVDGSEQVVWDAGAYVVRTSLSHDERSVVAVVLTLQPNATALGLARDGATSFLTPDDEAALHHHATFTADDTAVVLTSNRDREHAAVVRLGLADGSWEVLVEDDAHDVLLWAAPDGSALVVGTLDDGAVRLAIHEPDGAFRCRVEVPDDGLADVVWARDAAHLVVTTSRPTDPGSLHLVDAATGAARLLVDATEDVPDDLRDGLVTPTLHRVPTPDGEEVPLFRYPPAPGSDPALAGASVVVIHGGPESAAYRSFGAMTQVLCSLGLTVLVPNVRGSTGYGKRWYALDDVELRLDSVADLAAVHAWLPEQGLAPERSALWGGSYGGYMVLAGLTMQPDLWAAGVDIVGISSLVTFLENTSDYRRAYREREYGSLAEHRDFLESASPLTHLAALRAPLFVIHGANDPRVPLSEAEQIKAALDERGIRCDLRVYADEGHGLAKRPNRVDAYTGAVGFLLDVL
ncbi:prolyl oligopeptidase family serine peptidase [Nocardioides sp.]|uniref:S9 family peptidase n=1 Tax=Nocardioides sp. TaxID=35761 RepID=UPI0027287819|nr:prolyl oligopeptidase family serine peptidase [Nocardioides sp.]MDO9457042.1 prolyl oligopeptidase family serine peptidase [Nocardioides sp.]